MGNTLSNFAKQENSNNYMNNNNMEKWAVSAMCHKPCLLFPIVSERLYKLITFMSTFQYA